MNRKQLIRETVANLRQNGVRKEMPSVKHVLHISDDEGNTKNFTIRQQGRGVLYNIEDIETILDYLLFTIYESIRRGEKVTVAGLGTFTLRHRKQGFAKPFVEGGEPFVVPEKYVPKFLAGSDLKNCAALYQSSIEDVRNITLPLSYIGDDEEDDEEDPAEDGEA